MNKNLKTVLILAFAVFAIIAVAIMLLPESEKPTLTSELPYRYEVYNHRAAGGDSDIIRISTSLYVNEKSIPIKGDEIRISYYALSESDNTIFVRDESGSGEWQISTSFVDGRRDMKAEWDSGYIEIGETIFLPTGERLTFLKFDSEGNPLFSVVE